MSMAVATRIGHMFQASACSRSTSRPRHVVTCAAQEQQPVGRRSLLAGLALLSAAPQTQPAMALGAASRWDGESSAIGSCELGDAGAECRKAILAGDRAKLDSYDAAVGSKAESKVAYGVPVADMSSKSPYGRDTIALTDKVLAYAALNDDPANPERLQLVKDLKAEFPKWVSKYARGGSARTVSARKVYVVVDAISAHFANNGLAPLPRPKLQKLVADVEAGRQLLAEGK